MEDHKQKVRASQAIESLVAFALYHGLLVQADRIFARNALQAEMGLDEPYSQPVPDGGLVPQTATTYLQTLCDIAQAQRKPKDVGVFRDQFTAHLMNLVTPSPSQIIASFQGIWRRDGIHAAADWFYALCKASDYIRVDEIARNIMFAAPSSYGELEITINLSKPEKDPKEIARLKDAKPVGYPLCMLCVENEGYVGRLGYPSHETLRIIPLTLGSEAWGFQYSPYSYYEEHCIALNTRHIPMNIGRRTFELLFDFLAQFPHYFIGSNADLPIVGGSILNHDHFQGGRHTFPMDRAPAYASFAHAGFPSVQIEAIRWPMTCLRLTCRDREPLVSLADHLLSKWRQYDDPQRHILHETWNEEKKRMDPHNSITPILRHDEAGGYRLQLVLRNNRTTDEHAVGIFHPHENLHHIKRENIGLIEVMGLFVLPGRLRDELKGLEAFVRGDAKPGALATDKNLSKHQEWIEAIVEKYPKKERTQNPEQLLRDELAIKCVQVLEDAGVFKPTPDGDAGLASFLQSADICRHSQQPAHHKISESIQDMHHTTWGV